MKIIILLITLFLFVKNTTGKPDSTDHSTEYQFSLNKTQTISSHIKARLGFGIGVYHTFRQKKNINFKIGFEYNRMVRFLPLNYFSYTNLGKTCVLNNVAIPMTIRFNFGEKTKLFVESGTYIDCPLKSTQKGYVESNNHLSVVKISKENVNTLNFDFGFSGGIGIRIPIKNKELIVKTELKIDDRMYEFDKDEFFNRYYNFSIGYIL